MTLNHNSPCLQGLLWNQFIIYRGCLCDNWKPSFWPLLIFNWRTFSRRVTARWWRQRAKNQVLINQNSRNRWYLIVKRTICIFLRLKISDSKWVRRLFFTIHNFILTSEYFYGRLIHSFLPLKDIQMMSHYHYKRF